MRTTRVTNLQISCYLNHMSTTNATPLIFGFLSDALWTSQLFSIFQLLNAKILVLNLVLTFLIHCKTCLTDESMNHSVSFADQNQYANWTKIRKTRTTGIHWTLIISFLRRPKVIHGTLRRPSSCGNAWLLSLSIIQIPNPNKYFPNYRAQCKMLDQT